MKLLMDAHTNSFERLFPALARASAGGRLSARALRDVEAFRTSPDYRALPTSAEAAQARGNEALFSLRCVADALADADTAPKRALRSLHPLLALPLAPDPFFGEGYALGRVLAERLGDAEAGAAFAERYRRYLERYAGQRALSGLTEVITDFSFETMLEAGQDTGQDTATRQGALEASPLDARATGKLDIAREVEVRELDTGPDSYPGFFAAPPPYAFVPFASADHEMSTRAYVVQVRKLIDPRVAAFALHRATLVDITDGDAWGREDENGRRYADLVLDFGQGALPLLRELSAYDLTVRLIFRDSEAFESFSVAEGTLFDLEVSPEEGRLYFKLRLPTAWIAADLPLQAVWSTLESCVLISDAPEQLGT